MVTPDEFRKALGKTGEGLSDEEIITLNTKSAKFAELLFDIWTGKLCKKYDHAPQVCKECRIERVCKL